jgi:hypothetical protein
MEAVARSSPRWQYELLCSAVMVVVMMVMVVRRGNHLRLRRDRSREAEDQNEPCQKPFHVRIDADLR